MHLLGRTDDGIDRAGLNAKRAANTQLFINDGYLLGAFFHFQRLDFAPKQVGQLGDTFLATGRA